MTNYYVLRDGEPVPELDVRRWARWFEGSLAERRVAADEPVPGVWVSTMFLGLDHGFGGTPLLYETMIFDDDGMGHPLAEEQWRYQTKAEAVAGHAAVVRAVRDASPGGRAEETQP